MNTRERGYTYLGVLILVAVLGLSLAGAGEAWRVTAQRERERELLFVGEEFRRAMHQYYEASPGAKRFPMTLQDLVKDPRYPNVRRYLRRIYVDPMTGSPEWGLLRAADGTIAGVHSLSDAVPLKTGAFPSGLEHLEGQRRYSGWVFRPETAVGVPVVSEKID